MNDNILIARQNGKSHSILERIKKVFGMEESNTSISRDEIAKDMKYIQISEDKWPDIKWENLQASIIHIAPNLYLAHRAARVSINKPISEDIEARKKHIENLVKLGHESILEHTNVISMITIPENSMALLGIPNMIQLLDMLSKAKYLTYAIAEKDGNINILLGGSIRGYIHLVRENSERNNFMYLIREIMYNSMEKCFLRSLINEGLLEEEKCTYEPNAEMKTTFVDGNENEEDNKFEVTAAAPKDPEVIKDKYADIVYFQDPKIIIKKIQSYGFKIWDALKVSQISIFFHDVSRACANQLVRHRAGITQESQRYVESETKDNFINPLSELDKYKDIDTVFKEVMENYTEEMFCQYKKLIDHGILREDARSWLPMNVKTKLMMTFTIWGLIKFLELRMDSHAQWEIQRVANHVYKFYPYKDYWYNQYFQPEAISKRESEEFKVNNNYEDNSIVDEDQGEKFESNPTPIEINSVEDAEKYMKENEALKKLEDTN